MLFKYKKGKELIYWSDWHYPSITHKDWEDIYVNHLNLGIQLHFYYDINSNFIPFLNIGYIHRYSDNKSAFKYFRNDPVVIGQSGLEVNFDSTYTISSYLSLLRVFDPWNYEQYEINVLFVYWLSDQIGFKTQLFHNITYNLNGARLGIIYNL